jgi:hypothetical protein
MVTRPWMALLCMASALAACGDGSPTCENVGHELARLEIRERYGHVGEFMTAQEQAEFVSRWTARCETEAYSARAKDCVIRAGDLQLALECVGATPE